MKIILKLFLILICSHSFSQNVVIAENESTADAAAILDVQSTAKGVLLPRLTEIQRTSIASPATGLIVYQTDNSDGFYFYNGSGWLHLIDGVEEDPEFNASPANSITSAGSGEVITVGERDILQKAVLDGNGAITLEDTLNINSVLFYPKMTKSERDAITSVAVGSIVFQTDNTPGLRIYENDTWYLVNPKVAFLSDVKSQGSKGGSNVVGYQTRELNTQEGYTDFFSSALITNQFSLEPGTYLIEASAPAYRTNRHQLRLYNVSNDEVEITSDGRLFVGTSEQANSTTSSGNRAFLQGAITIAASSTYRLEHYTQTVQASEGLGLETNQTSEVYAIVKITKIAD